MFKKLGRRALTSFAFLTIALPCLPNSNNSSDGCLIHQQHSDSFMILNKGSVGQTFTPCETGLLEYVNFYVASTNNESFGARLHIKSIDENGESESIFTQQLFIPGKEQTSQVKTWIAEDLRVDGGENYSFEIEIPENRHIKFLHSNDVYEEGHLLFNKAAHNKDLAFDLGIRIKENEKSSNLPLAFNNAAPCKLQQTFDEILIPIDNPTIRQTFESCENVFIDHLRIPYRAFQPEFGLMVISQLGNPNPLIEIPFSVNSTPEMDYLDLEFDDPVFIMNGETYILEFQFDQNPNGLHLFGSDQDEFRYGSLIYHTGHNNMDLAFELMETNFTDIADFEPKTNDEWCHTLQSTASYPRVISGQALVQDFDLCSSGTLRNLVINMRHLSTLEEPVTMTLQHRGATIWKTVITDRDTDRGFVEFSQMPPLEVVADKYQLKLEVPSSEMLLMMSSELRQKSEGTLTIDGILQEGTLALMTEVEPSGDDTDEPDPEKMAWSVYPNPFVVNFNVKIDSNIEAPALLTLYNFTGNEVYRTEIADLATQKVLNIVPEGELLNGYYTLRLDYEDQVVLETLVKK